MKNELIHMGNMRGGKWEKTFEESRRFYSADGISPTVTAKGGGNQEIKIGELMPRLVGGVGEKKSNNGTQFYQHVSLWNLVYFCLCSFMGTIIKTRRIPIEAFTLFGGGVSSV